MTMNVAGAPKGDADLIKDTTTALFTKDVLEAAKWHLVAKAGGQEDEALEKLVSGLSKADRQKAAVAAAEWREQTLLE